MTPEKITMNLKCQTTPLPCHEDASFIRAKAKYASMCSTSLIAIGLKGLAALGEALKNNRNHGELL